MSFVKKDYLLGGAAAGAFYGAAGGAGLGGMLANRKYDRRKPAGANLTVKQRDAKEQIGQLKGMGLGVLAGAAVGTAGGAKLFARKQAQEAARQAEQAEWDAFRNNQRARWDDFFNGRRAGGGAGAGDERRTVRPVKAKRSHGTLAGVIGFDPNKVTTKKQAKTAYRAASMKHHPDRGGNPAKMSDLNNAWEELQATDWFEKLAQAQRANGGRFSALMFTVG